MNKGYLAEGAWCLFMLLVVIFIITFNACDRIPITRDDDWAFQETTTLVRVGYTPEGGLFGNSALMLEFENGLVLIESNVYFDKKDFKLGAEYEIYKHRATEEIKVRKK